MINIDKRKGITLMNTETYEDLITIEDLCEILSIGKNTAYHLLNAKEISAFRIGRIWKIPRVSVATYIKSHTEPL